MRLTLARLAEKLDFIAFKSKPNKFSADSIAYEVGRLSFDAQGKSKSETQLVLDLTMASGQFSKASAALAQIQKNLNQLAAEEAKRSDYDLEISPDWIFVKKPTEIVGETSSFRFFALGLLGGLVVGAGSALIADRRSNRVYSQAGLLRRLAHPLRLGLPAGSWSSSAVQVMVGQLATQLDQALAWRVLSIARQHDAVAPLTQLLQQQGGPDLQCSSADPLLSSVLRLDPRDQPVGLLLVVEAGFNSARALEDARLLISQMSSVQAVGVVLIGVPLPEELSPSAAG